jgi:hypothetical protein
MANDQLQRLHAVIGQLNRKLQQQESRSSELEKRWEDLMRSIEEQPKSITEEIDSIPGRRIFYNLSDRQQFDISQDGRRGDPLTMLVSQDGSFIQTHYPLVTWKPVGPDNATNLGFWRPVSHWPLPDQVVDGDIIDLSYEVISGGSQRLFQNEPAGAGPMSRPDNLIPLPVPTLYSPNDVIQFYPTFDRILFDTTVEVPTTQGELSVVLPGYRIVNL